MGKIVRISEFDQGDLEYYCPFCGSKGNIIGTGYEDKVKVLYFFQCGQYLDHKFKFRQLERLPRKIITKEKTNELIKDYNKKHATQEMGSI